MLVSVNALTSQVRKNLYLKTFLNVKKKFFPSFFLLNKIFLRVCTSVG